MPLSISDDLSIDDLSIPCRLVMPLSISDALVVMPLSISDALVD